MSRSPKYVDRGSVPDDEVLRDSRGAVVDDTYVDRAVEDAIASVRGRGRPSLSASGESPLIRVRVSKDLETAVTRAAQAAGATRSEWVRRVLDEAVRKAG
jgi:hypothetical protein